MARRRPAPDPEVLALARERLIRVLGGGEEAPRRAARVVLEDDVHDSGDWGDTHDEGGGGVAATVRAGERDGRAVGLDDLAPPRRFTRWHLGIVAVVLLVGMVWGGWSWLQARPEAVAAPTVATASVPETTPSASSAGSSDSAGSATPAAGLVVHVLGAVRRPGLVRLPVGARVEDAIEGAGGLRADADPAELNLAQPLDDGVQVVVGTTKHPAGEMRSAGGAGGGSGAGTSGSTGSTGSSGSAGSSAGTGATVDLNRASVDQLETLPGVGPVTAQKILDWRTQHGRFSRVEELQEVDGIGPKTYARMAPHARV